ncbi:dehydrogenase [Agrobacterium salinitolerans]|uniref:dehydrogenase n=1 Tax=Agrobacterium salinitolerans TaxID=1183413 RepID=UPI003FD4552E
MRAERREPEADPVDHIIAWHDGDSRAAIETLMEDIQHLRMQLALATAAMGKGFTRGWKPEAARK